VVHKGAIAADRAFVHMQIDVMSTNMHRKSETYQHLIECLHQQAGSSIYKTQVSDTAYLLILHAQVSSALST